ncbi:TPA: hypothetical protein H1005_00635 [archaeon]|uniref:Uncharacterized protein n=1 Tax=Candidatus Naiadarchaeum limnaeum TaxID=2756139 RepID=A0A832UVW0_9ARCH|nr:hypothetical protein [Candidatus Naiadarchaeales archaeon SRR2090153.bin1042]HIK00715.1 hypothetical protein [Candidatus Naiadarchaeum limnaeum]
MIPDLFLLGGLDLITGLFLLSMRAPIYKLLVYTVTPDFVLLLAIAIIVKGVYSIVYGLFFG